jgi:hypothetical protein
LQGIAQLGNTGCAADGSDCVMAMRLTESQYGQQIDWFTFLLQAPSNMTLPPAQVTATIERAYPTSVTLSVTGGVALYVTVTATAHGRFSENALPLVPGQAPVIVEFLPFLPGEQLQEGGVRVEHLAMYTAQATKGTVQVVWV